MNYEYTPKRGKVREISTAVFLFGIGLVFFYLPLVLKQTFLLPFQLAMLVIFIIDVLVLNRYILRSYTYRVETDPDHPEASDFVICEHYGRRDSVACRIGLAQVRSVTRPDKTNRSELAERMKNHKNYVYVAEIAPPDVCIVEACADDDPEEESIFLKISADETLFSILSHLDRNICPLNNEK